MRALLLAVALLALCTAAAPAAALRIGGAPAYLQLGEVRPGESRLMDFFLTTDSGNDLVVDVYSKDAMGDFFSPDIQKRSYAFLPENASEQSLEGWVQFMDNPVIVPPEQHYEPSVNANVNRQVAAVLRVPADAEPGYHIGFLSPSPRTSSATGPAGGTALQLITLVEIGYVFVVPGEAVRDGRIVGFDYAMKGQGAETVSALFRNTGTVTVTAESWIDIYGPEGRLASLKGSTARVRPVEIAPLTALWTAGGRDPGEYEARARVSWQTGEAESTGRIELLPYMGPAITAAAVQEASQTGIAFPAWIVPIAILIFALIIYRRYR
jgi:hypothetical protein